MFLFTLRFFYKIVAAVVTQISWWGAFLCVTEGMEWNPGFDRWGQHRSTCSMGRSRLRSWEGRTGDDRVWLDGSVYLPC